ncbi:hypothetical protein PLICRDRAFT_531762 [Plicaturopsis crispa FD-325 SS-3]|nr:hypothetical protein PLICRDRAFT_531762 [Plicaturopsis crispa FD-325 SS-3]
MRPSRVKSLMEICVSLLTVPCNVNASTFIIATGRVEYEIASSLISLNQRHYTSCCQSIPVRAELTLDGFQSCRRSNLSSGQWSSERYISSLISLNVSGNENEHAARRRRRSFFYETRSAHDPRVPPARLSRDAFHRPSMRPFREVLSDFSLF